MNEKNKSIDKLKKQLHLIQKLLLSNRKLYSQISLLDVVNVIENILREFAGADSGAIFISGELRLEPLHRFGSIPKIFFVDGKGELDVTFVNKMMCSNRAFINKKNDPALPLVCYPLRGKSGILGTFVIYSFVPEKLKIEPWDLDFFSLIADQSGVALQSALLFEELELQRSKLQKAYDQLKELDQLKSDFVNMVSHELRTALTIINSTFGILKNSKLSSELKKSTMAAGIRAVSRLKKIVEAQFTLTKTETGKAEYHFCAAHAGDLVIKSLSELKILAQTKRLKIENKITQAEPPVLVDPNKIIQVLSNLIHNSIKFTPPGGKISISSKMKDKFLEISVEDNGIGISKSEQKLIFEKYKQTQTTREVGGGIGLGLSLAYLFVKAHGGTIKVVSQENNGSCFSFTLPIAEAKKKAAKKPQRTDLTAGRKIS